MVDWDKRYAEADASMFGRAPNNYVVQTLARPDFTARSALCLADGAGRNGRYLAQAGLAVTGVDLSGVATELAIAHDAAANVTVERFTADLADWRPPADQRWDAAFLIYLHCERTVRRRAVELAARHLAPGGWFVAEGFAVDDGTGPRMGPPDPDLRYRVEDFDSWLTGFDVIEALTGVIRLDEGAKHQGLAPIVRYAARKP